MYRLSLAVALCLSLLACKKEQPQAPASSAPETAAAPSPAAPEAAEKPAAEPKLDEGGLKKYIAYEKDVVARMPEHLAKFRAVMQQAQSGKDSVGSLDAVAKFTQEVEAQNQSSLKAAGLTPGELARWDAVVSDVVGARQVTAENPMEKAAAEMRARMKTLPADQQAQAQAALKQMEDQAASLKALTEQRQQYGDAAVDLVLKNEAELKSLRDQRTALFAQLGQAGAPAK